MSGATRLTLHLWRYDAAGALRAVRTHRLRRAELEATRGLVHHQPVLTSDLILPTPRRLGLLCAWDEPEAADAFLQDAPLLGALGAEARASVHLRLQPVRANGTWHGTETQDADALPLADDEPVLAIVHARLRPSKAVPFYVANARAVRHARAQPGYLGGIGVHEGPRRFGSLSMWRSVADMAAYAYRPGGHQPVLRPSQDVPWLRGLYAARLRPLGPDLFADVLRG